MPVLTDIACTLDTDTILKKAHIDADTAEMPAYRDIVERARARARPKAMYRECFVTAHSGTALTIDTVTFHSRILADLITSRKVYPFVATCGTEIDSLHIDTGDLLIKYFFDTVKETILRDTVDVLNEHIRNTFGIPKTASICPGSADKEVWPLEQQKELFSLLGDVQAAIGVCLSASCLMQPAKSISGLFFPTAVDFTTCQLCTRRHCPSRKAAYTPAAR